METQVKAKIYKDITKKPTSCLDDEEEKESKIGNLQMNMELQPQASTSVDQTFDIPEPDYQALDTPISERTDSNYKPLETHKSR